MLNILLLLIFDLLNIGNNNCVIAQSDYFNTVVYNAQLTCNGRLVICKQFGSDCLTGVTVMVKAVNLVCF